MTTTTATNRRFRLKSRPAGRIQDDTFELVTEAVGKPGPGEFVLKNLLLSLDPTNRIWITDRPGYMPPVQIGEVMRGIGIGRVVESNNPAYKVGQLVTGLVGWQDYTLVTG